MILGRKLTDANRLSTNKPELALEWHPTKNGLLTPNDVTIKSDKNVWWECEHGHEWQSIIGNRYNGTGCPYCCNKRVSPENSLAITNPVVAKQWNYKRNGILTPRDVSQGSDKKVWWICTSGHEWKTEIYNRKRNAKCPYCNGRKVSMENCLAKTYTQLSSEWDYDKNNLSPFDVTGGSNRKVWWKCKEGHEWQAVIASRAKYGNGCSYCAGQKATITNNLLVINPILANEWNYCRNGDRKPSEYLPFSNEKIWWICEKGHEWETTINSRSSGSGCPICNKGSQTSFPEQAIFYYLSKIFMDTQNRYKLVVGRKKYEIDLYIPSLKLAIEYDGELFHKNKVENDEKKNLAVIDKGITMIRVRENGLPVISAQGVYIIYREDKFSNDSLKNCIIGLSRLILENFDVSDDAKTKLDNLSDIDIDNDRSKINELTSYVRKEMNLIVTHPDIVSEWDYDRNGDLRPSDVTFGSRYKVWWKCVNGHSWQAYVYNRTNGSNCPYCSGNRFSEERSLTVLHPELLEEWDYTKNILDPAKVMANSGKKAWWKCRFCGHEWNAVIASRSSKGTGCNKCSYKNGSRKRRQ